MGHQVGCYLSFAQVEQLDDLAHAAEKCRSALLRDIVADFLKEPSTEIKDLRVSQLDGMDYLEGDFRCKHGTLEPAYPVEWTTKDLNTVMDSEYIRRFLGLP